MSRAPIFRPALPLQLHHDRHAAPIYLPVAPCAVIPSPARQAEMTPHVERLRIELDQQVAHHADGIQRAVRASGDVRHRAGADAGDFDQGLRMNNRDTVDGSGSPWRLKLTYTNSPDGLTWVKREHAERDLSEAGTMPSLEHFKTRPFGCPWASETKMERSIRADAQAMRTVDVHRHHTGGDLSLELERGPDEAQHAMVSAASEAT